MEKIFIYYNTKNNYYRYKLVNSYYHDITVNTKNQYEEILIKEVSLKTCTSLEKRTKELTKRDKVKRTKKRKKIKLKVWIENPNTINLQT